MKIYIAKNGQQLGPFDEEQLTQKIQQGIVSYDDLAWVEGMSDWRPLRQVIPSASGTPVPPPVSPSGFQQQPMQKIPNYLVQSILVTLFCCLPFGIIGIVYASKVNSKLQIGDINGALADSKKAYMWSCIAFACGMAFFILGFNIGLYGK